MDKQNKADTVSKLYQTNLWHFCTDISYYLLSDVMYLQQANIGRYWPDLLVQLYLWGWNRSFSHNSSSEGPAAMSTKQRQKPFSDMEHCWRHLWNIGDFYDNAPYSFTQTLQHIYVKSHDAHVILGTWCSWKVTVWKCFLSSHRLHRWLTYFFQYREG